LTGGEARADISVIIVSWNTRELTGRCLRTLRTGLAAIPAQIIVVDNGSTDGTAEMVRAAFPDVQLLARQSNEGYTRANNAGIAIADGRYILLLNSDAFVKEGCVERLIYELEHRPGAAAVAPRLVYGDGRWQRWTAGAAPTLRTAANHYLFLERLLPGRPVFPGLYLGADVRQARRVDWVSSACMLLRADALRAVGGLDERLFVYMDDVDLCQRLRDARWEIWYLPAGRGHPPDGPDRPGTGQRTAIGGVAVLRAILLRTAWPWCGRRAAGDPDRRLRLSRRDLSPCGADLAASDPGAAREGAFRIARSHLAWRVRFSMTEGDGR